MSSGAAGRKRKLNGKDAGVDSDAESVLGKYSRDEYTVGSEEHARHGVDRTQELLARIQKVEEERKEIEDGTHPEWVRKSDALQRVKDRRIFAAERFKQMQIDNIQGLYEYEVREAEASFKASVDDLRGKLVEAMEARIKKLEDDRDRVLKQLEKLGQSRVLRSKYEKRPEERGAEKEPTTQPKAAEDVVQATVSMFLSEAEIKDDLKRITTDLADRAKQYYDAASEPLVDVFVEDNCLHYQEHCLLKGESVVFTSMMSGEDFFGRIASVRPHELLVKLTDGTKARIHLSYLRNGRIKLKLDDDYALDD